jgi:hypothetical protein
MMSDHRKPLSELERLGLEAHGLGRHIGKPSQLVDVFRHGIAWALANTAPVAWFDNAGNLHGRVSDEQLEAMCRSALASINSRNGWMNDEST